jgi:AcrR family transcriptional regulator
MVFLAPVIAPRNGRSTPVVDVTKWPVRIQTVLSTGRIMETASARRDHLVETALRLFYKNGFHATGIDSILAESGVAKMTLYKYFKSKDELILAALELRHERWSSWFRGETERRSRSPRRRLVLVFDILGEWFLSEDFRGCFFLNAASEYGGLESRIQEAVAEHKRQFRELLERLASEARATDANGLAERLALLADGAISVALVQRNGDSAQAAKDAAEVLIRAAIPRTASAD